MSTHSLYWQQLPKVLLHEHLDGGLRPQTLLALCQERNLAVPASDAATLAAWMQANANSGSLERYLLGFGLTVAAMASAERGESRRPGALVRTRSRVVVSERIKHNLPIAGPCHIRNASLG